MPATADRPAGRSRTARAVVTLGVAAAIALFAAAPAASPVLAADELTMDGRVLLQGHSRVGSWMAIRVDLRNDGPSITGELRIAAGSQGQTSFSTPVDLPTQSAKSYVLYGQPPSFGRDLEVVLVEGSRQVARKKVAYATHDPNQLIVGIVAEDPRRIVGGLRLIAAQGSLAPAIVTLGPADLPERVEAWAALDRLVWQDIDTNELTTSQKAALRGWLAGGGRLVLAGGTAGPSVLGGLPDDMLPYRPSATVDAPPATLRSILGDLPGNATTVTALGGDLIAGRALASVGDRVVAAELPYGAGSVTLLGFDPTVAWIGSSSAGDALWRRILPARSTTLQGGSDDSQLVGAVGTLPALDLPPISGLLIILLAYIALVGPINYLVLRRLDRREWAWVTMPILIIVFAVGSYGFGAALRGSDVIVNEIAIVRGGPDATEGTAQVYLGIFSPTRGTYQVSIPGGALLSAPLSGDIFGGGDQSGSLDVIQGDTARIRDLAIGFGSLRAVRADTPALLPRIQAQLTLSDDRLVGTIRNASDQTIRRPAVVLGSSVAVLADLGPGEEATVNLKLGTNTFGSALSDRILGERYYGDPSQINQQSRESLIRHSMIDQLTWDPNFGSAGNLPADGPVLLAFGDGHVLDVAVQGQAARRSGQVLYYIPLGLATSGTVVFRSDLIRSAVINSDAGFFDKNPYSINFGRGSVQMAYTPVGLTGELRASRLLFGLNYGGDFGLGSGNPQEVRPTGPAPTDDPGGPATTDDPGGPAPSGEPGGPAPTIAPECKPGVPCPPDGQFDGLPEIEIFDVSTSTWMRLAHLQSGPTYSMAEPARYVDPANGTVLVRFVNEFQDGVSFVFNMQIEGTVR